MFIVAPECKETKTGSNSSTGKEKIDLPLLKKNICICTHFGIKKRCIQKHVGFKEQVKKQ